jgi:SAM-dependent methyltransferase
MSEPFLRGVTDYFEQKLAEHGASPRGVDWNGAESQLLRFEKLCEVLPAGGAYSVLDFGCGYGAMLDHLRASTGMTEYVGYDVSERMVEAARARHAADTRASFTSDEGSLAARDFAFASGVFNVKLGVGDDEWYSFVLRSIDRLNALSLRGYAFNALTLYSDPPKRRDYLYYADPLKLFDHCKRHHSKQVALLHDYPLYDFTIIVRKDV